MLKVWNECQGKKETVLGLAYENEVAGRQYYKTRISFINKHCHDAQYQEILPVFSLPSRDMSK
ncbi:hypothetical protein METP1_02183 [Methanosarcinales archaeon]|nr:hypothetical protein METP1_02183 [Methanosarcinales archaeon]